MNTTTRVQNLKEAVCISHGANIFGKGMNPTILPPAIGKYWGILGSLTLLWQLVYWVQKQNME